MEEESIKVTRHPMEKLTNSQRPFGNNFDSKSNIFKKIKS
jgi:hypothetical protein